MKPYALTIESVRSPVVNLEMLYANKYLSGSGWQPDGSLLTQNALISSAIPNVTYREFLYQTMDSPFWLDSMYIESTTGDIEAVLTGLKFAEHKANGDADDITIIPTVDPYQGIGYALYVDVSYFVSGDISLIIRNIKLNETIRVIFYPSRVISKTELLAFRELLKNGYLSKEFYTDKNLRHEIGKRTRSKRVEIRRTANSIA